MKSESKSRLILSCLLCLMICINSYSNHSPDTIKPESKKWLIVLPLRFTHLQNNNTMLSGIKLGNSVSSNFNISLSIYHSFYLNSFKAEAKLPLFTEQPRLFINCMAVEAEYYLIKKRKVFTSLQLLTGWGFITYNSKEQNFKSKQLNYFALEPVLNIDFRLNNTNFLGLGVGYRPILSKKGVKYSSDSSSGELPIAKDFPNGLNIIISLKGLL